MRFIDKTISASDITPQAVFENRRTLIKAAAAGTFGAALAPWFSREALAANPEKLSAALNSTYSSKDELTPYKYVTSYNNFYEFGTDKADPAEYAHTLQTRPWSISIEGLVKKPLTLDIDTLLKLAPMEERIYRMRCVEGWSMVIPWDGYSLSKLISKVEPLGSAKYVEFISLADKKQMPGIKSNIIDWPYREGLRMDVRIVVPWKYGFKSAKSIVKIRFTEEMPKTSWNMFDAREYGFYSNVNPQVDHPRWSQAMERRIGDAKGSFAPKIKTQMFNGYSEQVASMYTGMDLKKFY